jgi:uncharacterized SAM-binding protein YcdF (DUF218 family)
MSLHHTWLGRPMSSPSGGRGTPCAAVPPDCIGPAKRRSFWRPEALLRGWAPKCQRPCLCGRFWKSGGVPAGWILLDGTGRNTYENAHSTRKLLAAHGLRRVLRVTSARHRPRALASLRSAGVDAVPAATDFTVT